jgi:hypothetical protein
MTRRAYYLLVTFLLLGFLGTIVDDVLSYRLRDCMTYLPAIKDAKFRHWCEVQSRKMP